MFTRKQLLLIVTMFTVSHSTYPMFNSIGVWLGRARTSIAQNSGTAALVGAGMSAIGAAVYFTWKRFTRKPRTIVPASLVVDPGNFVGALYPNLPVQKKHRGTLRDRFIAAVYANDLDFLRRALRRKEFGINEVDDDGNTLLHHALLSDVMQEATITFLITAGINISQPNGAGCTAYTWAEAQGKLEGKTFTILDTLNPALV